jgi:hypothetical protein
MNRVEINYELTQLREERGRLETRLMHVESCMKALMAMRKSLEAKELSLYDEMFGG